MLTLTTLYQSMLTDAITNFISVRRNAMQLPKMLTIEETAKTFNLPKNFIRQAVLDGRIIHVKAGKKFLINAQKVEDWLNTGGTPAPSTPQSKIEGVVRPLF
jgi:excisionase family DNA binding protein